MVWKKLIEEYQEISTWLKNSGYQETEEILLKVFVLMLCSNKDLEEIMGLAVLPVKPHQLLYSEHQYEACSVPLDVIGSMERLRNLILREPIVLGEIYERTAKQRKANGVYYTPKHVISYILKHTVMHADIVQKPKTKILDPACGSGYFLLEAYDILFNKFVQNREKLSALYPEEDWSDDGIHRHILKYNLWGADVDAVAAEIAKVSLLLKRKETKADTFHIIVYDSLKRIKCDEEKNVRSFWQPGYDYVVGNPPYLSFGLRGAVSIDNRYKEYLRVNYSATAEYKLSYYVLFMQRGIELLCEGGQLGFIVPDSFLLGRYYSKIRAFILDNTKIEILAHIAAAVFKGASTGYSAICVLSKEQDRTVREQNEVKVIQVTKAQMLSNDSISCTYRQSYFLKIPHKRFRMFFAVRTKELVDYLERVSSPLREFASGHTGIRSLSKQRDVIALESKGDTWHKGLISGGQISRYGLKYEGHWLNIHADALYKGGWRQDVITKRKILLRQTGDSLTACIDDNGYYHLNNIHSFILKEGHTVCLDYLLLLLNSRLISFYYHAVSMEYGRPMAQTDIETLELMPIRLQNEINVQASSLVQTMEDCVRQTMGNPALTNKATSFDEYLNQLVYRIYGLKDEDIRYIEQYEQKLELAGRRVKSILKDS